MQAQTDTPLFDAFGREVHHVGYDHGVGLDMFNVGGALYPIPATFNIGGARVLFDKPPRWAALYLPFGYAVFNTYEQAEKSITGDFLAIVPIP